MNTKIPSPENKSFSTLTIKSVDDDQRKLTGIASSPAADREGDVVVPEGATFKTPFPLLSQHDHTRPIGTVDKMVVTGKGLEIEASIPKETGLGYVDMAWAQIKAGLIRGLSIGFRPLEWEPIETGYKFLSYEIFELSAVTVPANARASIQSIKMFDASPVDPDELLFTQQEQRAASLEKAAASIARANRSLAKLTLREQIK